MKIAMVAPVTESVPPALYGGTERVLSFLTEELVLRGHDVTLFASGDSQTGAKLHPVTPRALRLDGKDHDPVAYTMIELGEVYGKASSFDLIHNHLDYFAFPFARLSPTPTLTTAHGRLDLPEVLSVYSSFAEQNLVSISDAQRLFLPDNNWVATVYNGIDLGNFRFRPDAGNYLAFVGRISPEKRVDRAIEIARDTGMHLLIAAKVDQADKEYFEHAIEPQIRQSSLVDFVGEVDEEGKDQLFGGAYASVFPIDWPEPFGLTMVESMATGTPVIAYCAGSVPEVILDGVTGFVCDGLSDMVESVPKVAGLDRSASRRHVEERFSAKSMASEYEQVYQRLIEREGESRWARRLRRAGDRAARTLKNFPVPAGAADDR